MGDQYIPVNPLNPDSILMANQNTQLAIAVASYCLTKSAGHIFNDP
jgi:hypothetical protein